MLKRLMAPHARSGLSIAVLLLAAIGAASAQTATTAIPSNARPMAYGGWKCLRGFAPADQSCVAVKIPPHAYLDASGADWACDRGYMRTDRTCTAVKLPANAHADDDLFGTGWSCDRGYRNGNSDSCARIVLPANAFILDSTNLDASCAGHDEGEGRQAFRHYTSAPRGPAAWQDWQVQRRCPYEYGHRWRPARAASDWGGPVTPHAATWPGTAAPNWTEDSSQMDDNSIPIGRCAIPNWTIL